MKKYLIAFFAFAPVLCFGYLSSSDFTSIFRVAIYSYSSPTSSNFVYHSQGNLTPDTVYVPFYSSVVGVRFLSATSTVKVPSLAQYETDNVPHTANINQPISGNTIYQASYKNYPVSPFPRISSLFALIPNLYKAGYRGSGFKSVYEGLTPTSAGDVIVNFYFPDILSDVFSGTNSVWRSTVLDCLNSLESRVISLDNNLSSVNSSLSSLRSSYVSNNPFSDSNISNLVQSAFDLSLIDFPTYDQWLSDLAEYSQPQYSNSSLPSLVQSSILNSLNSLNSVAGTLQGLSNSALRDSNFNDAFKSMGHSFGAGAAGHYTTPLTNEMQRMTTTWVKETKAALSNNTQKIKDDLQAWKDQLSGPNGSQAAIVSALNGAMNNTGAFKVELQNANNSVYVHLDGPITLDSAQFQDVNNKLQANFDIFHDWVYDIPESWVRYFNMFRDNSTAVLTNQTEQLSLLSSLTNLLFEYSFNFTSNTMFAISNSFAGLSFTNQYLLLSDYQSFVDSSKYNDIISSLPPDLSSALSSYGFSDSSDYSGRWWAFITANSAYQSTLLSTNAALASTLRSALEQIDDDEEGSLLSRWLSLIDSIPDPEEIRQSVDDATNIVSNIGFERVDALYSTATQDLVSVVKGIYRDKSLPDNIRFVFIPAADGREEKYVDIPVGEHSSLWSLFRSGMAFALSVVTLLLFPKYVSWLVFHYTRLVERIIKSLHAYSHR